MATGARVRHYRLKMGWTLDQLSERSGVDVGTISAIEQRDSHRSGKFLQIAPAFGLTVEKLADETTDHSVFDAKPPAWPAQPETPKFMVKDDEPAAIDAWLTNAVAKLHEIHPEYREEVLCFLEWQVARKPRHQDRGDLPMAA